jgi:uncharacterized membrane-anchored protein YjiN (DUF445 family)
MSAGRNRIGIISLGAAFAGFLIVTFQPWLALDTVRLFKGLSLQALLTAFFDASLVGALADWFAVTALFKRPLGIKLPHTDILARNKDAIAEAVPRFLTSFVSEEKISAQLGTIDFAAKVEQLLDGKGTREEINAFVRGRLSVFLGGALKPGGDPAESLAMLVRETIRFAGSRIDPARAAGALLRWSRSEGLDDRLVSVAAGALREGITDNSDALVDALTPLVKRNAGWQGIFVGRGTIERLLRGAQEELDRVRSDPGHALRVLIGQQVQRMSSRLSRDTPDPDDLHNRVRGWFQNMVDDPSTAVRVSRFLAAALERLRVSMQEQGSGFLQAVERMEEVLASQLKENPEFRASFNRGCAGLVSSLIARSRLIEGVTGYLAGLLKNTDEREFVGRVEDAVWNDLQYIRFNGALVGGLVGILLSVISSLLGRG